MASQGQMHDTCCQLHRNQELQLVQGVVQVSVCEVMLVGLVLHLILLNIIMLPIQVIASTASTPRPTGLDLS